MRAVVVRGDFDHIAVKVAEQVIYQELEGEMVLLDLQTGGYYGLNEVGARIWQGLHNGQKLNDIIGELMGVYEVSQEQVVGDLRAFLASLEAQGLVSIGEDAA